MQSEPDHIAFKNLEAELDAKLAALSIWKIPFQTIISSLFYTIEMIDKDGRHFVAADYTSRISYLYDIIRNKAASAPVVSSHEAIMHKDFVKYINDQLFLNAYAHYSLLMPQFHRGTFKVVEAGEKNFRIEFTDANYERAETLDRLYSYTSLSFAVSYPKMDEIRNVLLVKAAQFDNTVGMWEAGNMKLMAQFYKRTSLNIQVLPDKVLESELGFSFDQYLSFCAAVRAYTTFSNELARAYFSQVTRKDPEKDDQYNIEHMEWSVCCLNKNAIGHILTISELKMDVFKKIFEYFLTIHLDSTQDNFQEKGHCGDGYFPPFIWLEKWILFSSIGTQQMLSFNNILYSVNKKTQKQFAEKISPSLEPTLIQQMEYVFSQVSGIKVQKNINYHGGEIDFVVLSEHENAALCFQVKGTVAPDSARTVQRVESRAQEGMDQLARFDALTSQEKDTIINNAFGTTLSGINLQNILMIRSCAGSATVWVKNDKYPILNYALLGNIISRKISKQDNSIIDFTATIHRLQDEMIERSKSHIVYDNLKIGDYEIEFPNVDSEMNFIIKMHTQTLGVLKEFEKVPV